MTPFTWLAVPPPFPPAFHLAWPGSVRQRGRSLALVAQSVSGYVQYTRRQPRRSSGRASQLSVWREPPGAREHARLLVQRAYTDITQGELIDKRRRKLSVRSPWAAARRRIRQLPAKARPRDRRQALTGRSFSVLRDAAALNVEPCSINKTSSRRPASPSLHLRSSMSGSLRRCSCGNRTFRRGPDDLSRSPSP
jgi:hypothetical protein